MRSHFSIQLAPAFDTHFNFFRFKSATRFALDSKLGSDNILNFCRRSILFDDRLKKYFQPPSAPPDAEPMRGLAAQASSSYAIDSDVDFDTALGKIVRHPPRAPQEVARTKSMIKGILWDNDGVLIDTEALYFQATRDVMGSAGVELTRERYVEWSLRQGRSSFDLLRDQGCTPAQIDELRLQRNQAYSRMLGNGPGMIDGIVEVLTLLRAKFRMAIVTTSRREHFDLMHQRSNLSQFFEFALTREDYERSKPHPEPYLTALERLQLSAKECVAIEDSQRGLAAANAAGLQCIVIPNGMTIGSAFADAAMVIPNAATLPDAIFRLARTPTF